MEKKLRLALYTKMLLGFIISFLVGRLFRLPYSYTAGVIAILHSWYSRDTVIKTAITRLISSLIGLAISALLFFVFGYTIINLFIMVFTVLAVLYLVKLESGATIALVLIGQQWAEQTAWAPLNALIIMVIGTVPALLLNMFTFKKSEVLLAQQAKLDHEISTIFTYIGKNETYDFKRVNNILLDTKNSLQVALENYRVANISAALYYMSVRAEQIKILERITETLAALYPSPYKDKIVTFLSGFNGKIGQDNFASDLLKAHDALLDSFRQLALPKTRDEFEHRALLFAILAEIKQFLLIKIDYHKAFPTT